MEWKNPFSPPKRNWKWLILGLNESGMEGAFWESVGTTAPQPLSGKENQETDSHRAQCNSPSFLLPPTSWKIAKCGVGFRLELAEHRSEYPERNWKPPGLSYLPV